MKAHIPSIFILSVVLAYSAAGQSKPGNPEDNGLLPKSATFYVNDSPDDVNNGKTESIGVAIANNGNVLIGWEDDGDGIKDTEAVWTLYNSSGVSLTSATAIKSAADGATLTSKYLSYFRKDGTPIPGNTAWGPKIKANLFGDGIGMGATCYGLDVEVPEFAAIQAGSGGGEDFPAVQLLSNDGKPISIVSGVSDSDATPSGNIRIGDWEYLSNGNIVIVGESRQKADLVSRWKGTAEGNHAIYRIVDSTGKEIRPLGMVSATPDVAEIWHGVGVTKNGFAVRFVLGGKATVRMFDNAGNPTSTNLDLATITGKAPAAAGGRGDSAGFHGNGVDAYVAVSSGTDENGAPQVWMTVLNTNGTVRFSKAVSDDLALTKPGRCDAAIDASGRVVVVFSDTSPTAGAYSLVLGRIFDAQGNPVGKTFYVSEVETAETANQLAQEPRVAWRSGLVVIAWETMNDPNSANSVVAARLFSTFSPGSVESVGLKRIVPDTLIINWGDLNALGNWEPYISVLGNSTFLIEGNTFADGSTTEQRYVVALQPADGKPMKLAEGFYADNGQPFKGQINLSRQNGNPGRVAGDKRPGAVNFMVGAETSVHNLPEFASDNRWKLGFLRADDARWAAVQIFKLNTAALTSTPLTKAIDPINGRLTTGDASAVQQLGRFGGDIACLDNGNFVVAIDDRSLIRSAGNITTAAVIAPDGTVIKDSFVVDTQDIWSNVAACKGGFCVRVHSNLFFYDNAGNLLGKVDQSTSGSTFDSGRGDGTRIAGHINSPYVFLAGKISNGQIVKVTAWDSRTQKFAAVAEVSEPGFSGDFDRVNLAVDALNRIVVSWVCKPAGYEKEQVAARVLAFDAAKGAITPVTSSFFAFLNSAKAGIRTLQMSVATTTKEICIAAKGEINLANKPELGVTSKNEMNFYTVISHPDPKDDPTTPVGGAAGLTGLLGYWRMDETAGDVVSDSSGKGNNGKIVNSTAGAWVKDAERGTVYRSTGTNVIEFGTILPIMSTNSDFTWSLWIKSDETGTASATDNNIVFGNRYRSVTGTTGTDFSPREFVKFTPSKFEWHVNAGAVVQDVDYTDFVTNRWAHHLVVKKGTSLTYYRDGQQATNRTITTVPVNAQPLFLGGQGTLERWRGYADEVAIFDRALSATEVQQVYDLGKAGASLTGGAAPAAKPSFGQAKLSGTTLTITWTGGGKLQEAADVTGPWTDVTGNPAGTYNAQTTGTRKFYRVVGP